MSAAKVGEASRAFEGDERAHAVRDCRVLRAGNSVPGDNALVKCPYLLLYS